VAKAVEGYCGPSRVLLVGEKKSQLSVGRSYSSLHMPGRILEGFTPNAHSDIVVVVPITYNKEQKI